MSISANYVRFAFFCLLLIPACSRPNVTEPALTPVSGDYEGCAFGAFVDGLDNIPAFQTNIGKKLAVVHWYVAWESPFPKTEADQVSANGSIPMITWEPWLNKPPGTLEAISSGQSDAYIRSFLQAAKEWGAPLFLRFGHEMNGNWYPWDGAHNGGAAGPERYKAAWRHLRAIKTELGADNVTMVFCPNNTNQPAESWNTIAAYYPGDEEVDWVGLDGYNWGESAWCSFDSLFGPAYLELTALSGKPLMIGEFACAETGGDKGAWISDALAKLKSTYPRVKLGNWFNINKERDWRVESSSGAAAAAKNSLQDAYFLDKIKR
ncbi:MAG: glycosyl hydrolase [Candidatus Margulisiibacteriota bacterium]